MTGIRLLTFNALIRGDVRPRLRALAGILQEAEYDVVCLQEILHRGSARLLGRRTPSYGFRAAGGFALLRGGLMMLSRWPLVRHHFTRYPVTGPARTELLMRKGAQVAVVRTPGGDLAVVNTHLSANRDDDWTAGNRYTRIAEAELQTLAALVAAIDPALPVVVAGDFNVPRHSPTLTAFRAAAGLDDLLSGDSSPTFRPTARFPKPPALDQIYLRSTPSRALTGDARLAFQDPVRLPDAREAYLSDHYAIEADLTLTGPADHRG
ncbi:endonuclease/exonuclease/phosphatase family protein [Phytohabitans houttuyneae]|uniref:endonuclease/exonuclease/phosphatase family protein n=1 Tax=Phytohabitans houttuyneae TaxID=1076126 RepID=UPI0015655676|nr:endonuclease/exonuclease/phosphatase family protein [Phytohabitans houttuyneae]